MQEDRTHIIIVGVLALIFAIALFERGPDGRRPVHGDVTLTVVRASPGPFSLRTHPQPSSLATACESRLADDRTRLASSVMVIARPGASESRTRIS